MALAVISLMQTLKQLSHPHHRRLPIHKLVKGLKNRVRVLRDFLKHSCADNSDGVKALETEIIDLACKADAIIRSNLLDIRNHVSGAPTRFPNELWKLLVRIDHVMGKVREFEKKGKQVVGNEVVMFSPQSSSSYPHSFPTTVVGLDDFRTITDRMLANSRELQVVSIVGMGGIGKTTLAMSVYRGLSAEEYFDLCAWTTVSQEFHERQVYLRILGCFISRTDELEKKSSDQLADLVYKNLKKRRYLIVLDDVWSTTTWDHLRRLFPNDETGSRILLTTRLGEVATYASPGRSPHHMPFLRIDQGWELLSDKVFKKQCCPPELEEIGKQIVFKCRGLPLAILVVAGLLFKVNHTIGDWKNVLENLNALVSSNAEDFIGILGLSYNQLPIHLKSCFVYTALFPEDAAIPVRKLIKLWIAEGLLGKVRGRSYEEVAEENLAELIDRSLVLISKHGSNGKPKTCTVHDLLRELCLREADAQKFLRVINSCGKADMKHHSRFGLHSMKWEDMQNILEDGTPNTSRSILCLGMSCWINDWRVQPNFWRFKLLRVLDALSVTIYDSGFTQYLNDLIYLRYIALSIVSTFPSFSLGELQSSLQTFILHNSYKTPLILSGPFNKKTQLRHLELGSGSVSSLYGNEVVFPDLQTFSGLCPSDCGKALFRHIPDLKKLGIRYYKDTDGQPNCLQSVHLLHNLAALKFEYMDIIHKDIAVSQKLNLPDVFPSTLKKLTLIKSCLPWKDMAVLGRLPNLETLKLKKHAFMGPEWDTTDEESFLQLKVLVLESLDLVCWKVSRSGHFPNLQRLVLLKCYELEGIPCEIGDILTLQEIEVDRSNSSVVNSAQEILEEQHNWGNDKFHLRFTLESKWQFHQ